MHLRNLKEYSCPQHQKKPRKYSVKFEMKLLKVFQHYAAIICVCLKILIASEKCKALV